MSDEKRISAEEDRRFWAQVNADFAALRDDPDAWAENLRERALWDATLLDGLWRTTTPTSSQL